MAVVTLGRPPTLPHIDHGFIAPGQMRGATFAQTSQNVWVYEMGVWGGRYTPASSSNVTARVALYAVDGSLNPAARRGYTSSMTITAASASWDAGASNLASVAASDGPLATAIPVASGAWVHLAVLGTVGYLGHGMQAASRISEANEQFYNRSGLSQPPPDPFGSYTASTEGHPVIWAVADTNEAPDTPTGLAPSGTITETVPTFVATFADDNEARGDYLNQYQIQVRRKSDSVAFWAQTLTASSGERSAKEISRAYAGTTLVRGTEYEWRVRMSDHFGAYSSWTAWTSFTPSALGTITLDDVPTGKVETRTPDFKGRWTHQSAEDMTHVQVRILNAAGSSVLQTGSQYDISDVASSSAPGTLFTVSWANTGLSTLQWGIAYRYQIRGRDESANWSDWSASRTFNVNALPSVPANLAPANSLASTTRPLLTCTASDADDTTGTGLVVYARVKDNTGSVISTEAMTLSGGLWQYQTDSGDLASHATYRWDAYSYDGTVYSGGGSDGSTATKSAEATFVYASGPAVTIASPTDNATVATATIPVEWSVSTDQAEFRVTLVQGAATVYDSGVIANTLPRSWTIPAGYARNGETYQAVVWVKASTTLEGQQAANIDIDFTPPDPVLNVAAQAVKIGTDLWASAIRVTWDVTTYGSDVWTSYVVTRTAASGADAGEIVLARVTSPVQTAYTDYAPASGIEYTYSVRQVIQSGLDELTSDAQDATAQVDLAGVVLASVVNPETLRTTLRHTNERDYGRKIGEAVYEPLDGSGLRTIRSRTRAEEPSFDAQLFGDTAATAVVRRRELEALDAARHTLCYRDNHGRKLFVAMPGLTIVDHVPDWWIAKVQLRAEHFAEGVD